MLSAFDRYINDIRDNLRLDTTEEAEVIRELQTHIEDEYQEMREAGLSEEEAVKSCIRFFGSAKVIARLIYETHSQGTWRESLLASLPHLLFAVLFTLNWWRGVGWVVIALSVVAAMTLYGWRRGKPVWLFPWRGYIFLPVLVTGILLLYLPKGWAWVSIVVYLPLVSIIVWSVTVKAVKRDWLYSGLMMLPVPITIGWVLASGHDGNLLRVDLDYVEYFATGIGLSFLALAVTTVVFLRMRRRWLRGVLLILSSFISLVVVTWYSEGRIGLPLSLGLILMTLMALLAPAVIDRRFRRRKRNPLLSNLHADTKR
ncbi:MAG: hypothetical protein JW712_06520 [Dehalococcoidales bacterium]|nr:hypothetical protein [Dehalococcoidales bacterium]